MVTVNARKSVKQALRKRLFDEISRDLIGAITFYGHCLNSEYMDKRRTRKGPFDPRVLEMPVHSHQKRFDALRGIDFSIADRVRPGAVCRIAQRYFVIAVAVPVFNFDGTRYAGLAEHSLMYQRIKKLKAGDTFDLMGKQMLLAEVF